MKAIIWIRTSTKEQSIEDQQRDLEHLAASKGYHDLLVIGKQGASAIKMDEQYKREVNTLIETLSSTDIKCVFVWEVSRLARNELAFYQMKDFIVKNKIQLYCKTPELKLLDDNGSINQGAEIALNLLVTLAKQEMQIKAARFKRKKDAMKQIGKPTNGLVVYGYNKTGKGFSTDISINEEEANNVRYVLTRYANESVSLRHLAKEMISRWEKPLSFDASYARIQRFLSDPCYYGGKPLHSNTKYEPIVSKDIWDKAHKRAWMNHTSEKTETKNVYYCKSILMNVEIGHVLLANRSKVVYQDNKKYSQDYTVSINAIDSLAWTLAKHYKAVMNDTDWENRINQYKANIETYTQEIETLGQLISNIQNKRKKAQRRLLNGIIDDDVYSEINKSWTRDEKQYLSRQADLKSEIQQIQYLIENKDDSDDSMRLTKEQLDLIQDDRTRRKIVLEVFRQINLLKVDRKKRLYQITYDLNVPVMKLPFTYLYTGMSGHKKIWRVHPDGMKEDISYIIEERFKRQ